MNFSQNFPPSDFCRCLNDECPRRLSCLRTTFDNIGEETPYVAFPSWPACWNYVNDGSGIAENEEEKA